MSRLQEIRDTAAKMAETPATESNLVDMRSLMVHGLNLVADELEGWYHSVQRVDVDPATDQPVIRTLEIPSEKLSGHKKASKKKSGD